MLGHTLLEGHVCHLLIRNLPNLRRLRMPYKSLTPDSVCDKSFSGSWIKAANHFLNINYCDQRVKACSNPTKEMKEIARKKLGIRIITSRSCNEKAKIENDKDIPFWGFLFKIINLK